MMEFLDQAADILTAVLAIIGGLKVIARYTKWTWDDKALETIETPLRFVAGFFVRKP